MRLEGIGKSHRLYRFQIDGAAYQNGSSQNIKVFVYLAIYLPLARTECYPSIRHP